MENQEKKLIAEQLFSTNENTVIEALDKIKKKGDTILLQAMIELLLVNKNKVIEEKIVEILNNIKSEKSKKTIIQAIENPKFYKLFKILASSVWMSGLNYGEYINTFAQKFISEEFNNAFEAFTIIDNTEAQDISLEVINNTIKTLKEGKGKISIDKQTLYNQLLIIIEEKKQNANSEQKKI